MIRKNAANRPSVRPSTVSTCVLTYHHSVSAAACGRSCCARSMGPDCGHQGSRDIGAPNLHDERTRLTINLRRCDVAQFAQTRSRFVKVDVTIEHLAADTTAIPDTLPGRCRG